MKQCCSGSQTVGPFFQIGLEYLCSQFMPAAEDAETVTVQGQVLDADRNPVPDAMLELWYADPSGRYTTEFPAASDRTFCPPRGFARIATDDQGGFSFTIARPGPVTEDNGQTQAPHLVVLVFARGLLRNLITRMYFPDDLIASDPVLQLVPEERRSTLIARAEVQAPERYKWDIVLQGTGETVFFAW